MTGDFRRGAEITNRARQAMHDKADAAARLERQVAEQRTAMEQAARAERQQPADQFEREVMSKVEAGQESAQTRQGNDATMSGEIKDVTGKAEQGGAAAHTESTTDQAGAGGRAKT